MQKRLKTAIFSGTPVATTDTPAESAPRRNCAPQISHPSPAQKLQQLRQDMPHAGYIRQAGLLAILPISSATLWRWVANGTFPQPVKLSPRVTAWPVDAVQTWLAASGDESSPRRVIRNGAPSPRL